MVTIYFRGVNTRNSDAPSQALAPLKFTENWLDRLLEVASV